MLFRNTHAARQSGEKYYRGTDYVRLVRNVTPIEGLVTSYATQWTIQRVILHVVVGVSTRSNREFAVYGKKKANPRNLRETC